MKDAIDEAQRQLERADEVMESDRWPGDVRAKTLPIAYARAQALALIACAIHLERCADQLRELYAAGAAGWRSALNVDPYEFTESDE
jgi:hypothetical protein